MVTDMPREKLQVSEFGVSLAMKMSWLGEKSKSFDFETFAVMSDPSRRTVKLPVSSLSRTCNTINKTIIMTQNLIKKSNIDNKILAKMLGT